MGMKRLSSYPAYLNYYHIVGAVKYRKEVFIDEKMRERLGEIIREIIRKKEGVEVIECAVAYNHVHVLIQTSIDISKVGQVVFGASSRIIREEYSTLKQEIENGLWGGKSWCAIKDETHLENCSSYIRRHRPDNTKMENDLE